MRNLVICGTTHEIKYYSALMTNAPFFSDNFISQKGRCIRLKKFLTKNVVNLVKYLTLYFIMYRVHTCVACVSPCDQTV